MIGYSLVKEHMILQGNIAGVIVPLLPPPPFAFRCLSVPFENEGSSFYRSLCVARPYVFASHSERSCADGYFRGRDAACCSEKSREIGIICGRVSLFKGRTRAASTSLTTTQQHRQQQPVREFVDKPHTVVRRVLLSV